MPTSRNNHPPRRREMARRRSDHHRRPPPHQLPRLLRQGLRRRSQPTTAKDRSAEQINPRIRPHRRRQIRR
ncbi:hypothetical protein LINPERPRIM_LOCUS14149 [Linum perenne]